LPGEIYDLIGHGWFWKDGDTPRPDAQLMHIYQLARSRGTNLLLDVPPDKHGRIPDVYREADAASEKCSHMRRTAFDPRCNLHPTSQRLAALTLPKKSNV
jgi:hypothetical protein